MQRYWATHRQFPRFSTLIWGLTAAACWTGLLLSLPGYYAWIAGRPSGQPFSAIQQGIAAASGVTSLLCALISLGLGTLLYLRRGRSRPALYVSFFLLLYGVIMAGPLEVLEFAYTGAVGEISFRAQTVFFSAPGMVLMLVFPNGVIAPARFRWLIPAILAASLLMSTIPAAEMNSLALVRNQIAYGLVFLLWASVLGAQVYRYWKVSNPHERQQTKVVLLGFVLQFLLLFLSSLLWFQLPVDSQAIPGGSGVSSTQWWLALMVLPISLTIAVFRSNLWDIDLVIRRTLLYAVLTAALGLVYFASVISLQFVFRRITGQESPIAVLLSTLISFSIISPLRAFLQVGIDRRFFRSKYNAELALERFQNAMRGQVDLEQIDGEINQIVQSTLQPEWAEVWLRRTTKGS